MARTKNSRQRRNDPRMNIAFYDNHLQFCRDMAWKNHQSVTQYVNGLIAQEMANYDRAERERTNKIGEGSCANDPASRR